MMIVEVSKGCDNIYPSEAIARGNEVVIGTLRAKKRKVAFKRML